MSWVKSKRREPGNTLSRQCKNFTGHCQIKYCYRCHKFEARKIILFQYEDIILWYYEGHNFI